MLLLGSTKASDRDAEKTADYMLGRLNKSNLNVKLKALQIISVGEGREQLPKSFYYYYY